jgi:hypothetical protein
MAKSVDETTRDLLVSMLREAASLEHCLLSTYIYAACSIKSTPQEFATPKQENRRRAIQFERARRWKEAMLGVAVEEMRHLHLVQCMLRALGEPPCFEFPNRNQDGEWTIPNWRMRMQGEEGRGVQIPVGPLNEETIKRFVLYEASDSLQDAGPFSPENENLYSQLQDFELDLYLEAAVFALDDESLRKQTKDDLLTLYKNLLPSEQFTRFEEAVPQTVPPSPIVDDVRFPSISDFYLLGILPLYQQAFDFGWVKYNNRDLANEMQESLPQESILPVGPVYRSNRFQRFSAAVDTDPLRHYKNVSNIIHEIVDEGEGFEQFARRAKLMLESLQANGGARNYLKIMLADRYDPSFQSPDWFSEAQQIRLSHLYRFVIIMKEVELETSLSAEAKQSFSPSRNPTDPSSSEQLSLFCEELTAQINACYLVVVAWLSRIYEIQDWIADAPRRVAVEQLATWPLMSLALRPLLEIASFFKLEPKNLFRLADDAFPILPTHSRALCKLYSDPTRSETIIAAMDYLAVRTLTDIAQWAQSQVDAVDRFDLNDCDKGLITRRLRALKTIEDFEMQFPFRTHGGYSGQMPDVPYQREHAKEKSRYEEDPRTVQPLFSEAVLRLRFKGWGLVQLATDPDTPTDEAGAVGTLMLHPADGDKRLDRAILFQNFDHETTIERGPKESVPTIGVNCHDISLLMTSETGASAGYSPLEPFFRFQQPGDVQPANNIQYGLNIFPSTPLKEIASIRVEDILGKDRKLRVFLRSKDGTRAHLVGNNHLSWQDGEPIDPFVIGLYADEAQGAPTLLIEREIHNEGKSLLEMTPFQRIFTRREPCGFEFSVQSAIPAWAMSPEQLKTIFSNRGADYLRTRGAALAGEIRKLIVGGDKSENVIAQIASFADRACRVNIPRSTTKAWLSIGLNYGHTVSGNIKIVDVKPLVAALAEKLGLDIAVVTPKSSKDRGNPNSRWLVRYSKGVMDTDALSDFSWGELYIPVAIAPSKGPGAFRRTWSFPAVLSDDLAGFACDFGKPFWSKDYEVKNDARTFKTSDGTIIKEILKSKTSSGYQYELSGFKNLATAEGSFGVEIIEDYAQLTWRLGFSAADDSTIMAMLRLATKTTDAVTAALAVRYSPKTNPN